MEPVELFLFIIDIGNLLVEVLIIESEIEGQTGLKRTYLNYFWSLAELTIAEQLSKCLLAPTGALIGILVYYWSGNFFRF